MTYRILIVDDVQELSAMAARLLKERGYEVTTTSSGADALCRLADECPHDLLILDMIMPGVDGDAVLAALGPTAPWVILMSGGDIAEAARHPRVKRVLIKPFDDLDLLEAVESVLGRPQSHLDTTKDDDEPCVDMTDAERAKAVERYQRSNGGTAHAG